MTYIQWLAKLVTLCQKAGKNKALMPNVRYFWHEGFSPTQTLLHI